MWSPTAASAVSGVVDDVDAAQERLHRQPRRVARGSAGRQHMVGAGQVVAERDRRVGPTKIAPALRTRGRNVGRVAGDDLEVLGAPRIDDVDALGEVVDQDERRLAGQRRLDPLAVPGRGHSRRERGIDRVEQRLARRHEQARGELVVLGLRDQVGGEVVRIRAVVGKDPDLGRAGLGVDADDTAQQPLGRGDVDVARGRSRDRPGARPSTP